MLKSTGNGDNESYTMQVDSQSGVSNGGRKLIVKRIELVFNEKECQVLHFTDVTTYVRLKEQEETNRLLKAINIFVHHEMLAPLRSNIQIAQRLKKTLTTATQKQLV